MVLAVLIMVLALLIMVDVGLVAIMVLPLGSARDLIMVGLLAVVGVLVAGLHVVAGVSRVLIINGDRGAAWCRSWSACSSRLR